MKSNESDATDRRLADALERIGHVLRVRLRTAALDCGLSPIQAQLLMRVVAVDVDQRETARLAEWFDVRQATVSDAVAALRRKGLVVRAPVAGDGRRFRLDPTAEGQLMAARLADWDAEFRAELVGLAGSAKGNAVSLLLQLIGRMQRAGLVSVARTCTTCRFYRPQAHPGAAVPDHCALLDLPLAPEELRLDCPEHEAAA